MTFAGYTPTRPVICHSRHWLKNTLSDNSAVTRGTSAG